jgi:hypothetical protein
MANDSEIGPQGSFEARYLAFRETTTNLRPSLHRYCSPMTGSGMDGEDIVQEALFQAYRKLDAVDDNRPLAAHELGSLFLGLSSIATLHQKAYRPAFVVGLRNLESCFEDHHGIPER